MTNAKAGLWVCKGCDRRVRLLNPHESWACPVCGSQMEHQNE